jgi:hypothetical protein
MDAAGFGEGVGAGGGVEGASGGEFGTGGEDARRDHGDDAIALGAALGADEVVELEALDGADDGLDVAVGNGALDAEAFGGGSNGIAGAVVLEKFAQAEDQVVGPEADVGDGAVPDFSLIAVGFAQQNTGR